MIILLFVIVLGIFFWLANLRILYLARDWPLILTITGVFILLKLLKEPKRKGIIDNLEKGRITVEQAEDQLRKSM